MENSTLISTYVATPTRIINGKVDIQYIHNLITIHGLCILPLEDGKKHPGDKWKLYQSRLPSESEISSWNGRERWGIVCGKISGNLEVIDFDEKVRVGIFETWQTILPQEGLDLIKTLPLSKTINNGFHILYRCDEIGGNVPLAKGAGKDGKVAALIETRGEGGFIVEPPTEGYKHLNGSLMNIPTITPTQRMMLLDAAKALNEVVTERTLSVSKVNNDRQDNRPGDVYNEKATWDEILIPHGWVVTYQQGDKKYWKRPDKQGVGISATENHNGNGLLHVFSSSTPFESDKSYKKFTAYAILNHGGDFSSAAKAVIEMYPQDIPSVADHSAPIESIELMLEQIPRDTPAVKRIELLDPILRKLMRVKRIVANTFILNNIKDYFDMTKADANQFITTMNGYRAESARVDKVAKEAKERLPLIVDRDIDPQEAHDAISKIGIMNKETVEIVTAVVISAHLRLNPPLWLFLIGVPSSLKTEFVGLFDAMDELYTLDTLTENAFASGYVPPDGSETQDLLPLLDNKCFVVKDLNTLFSMNEEMVKKILGDLTSIFDGKFEKFTATRGLISYRSLFSMIGCITPSMMTKHYSYATQLGPRFFFIRLPELTADELQAGFNKSWSDEDRKKAIIEARQIVSSYSSQLIKKIKQFKPILETKEIQQKINDIALFVCKARGVAITDKTSFKNEKGDDVEYYDVTDYQVEQPWRILNQLKALLRILSFIHGKNIVDDEEIRTIRPIILSTMPVNRAEILSVLSVKCGISVKELSKSIQKSAKTLRRTIKELETLGIIDCFQDATYHDPSKAPRLYFIREQFASILNAPMPSPDSLSLSKHHDELAEFNDDEEAEDETDDMEELAKSIPF